MDAAAEGQALRAAEWSDQAPSKLGGSRRVATPGCLSAYVPFVLVWCAQPGTTGRSHAQDSGGS